MINRPLLMNETPIVVAPTLAAMLGINKAVILQQLHYLLLDTENKQTENNFSNGYYWVYNSYKQWRETYFKWLSESTLKSIFNELEADGIVVSTQGVRSAYDRRKWYRIDYNVYDKMVENYPMHETKNVASQRTKNVSSDETKNVRSLTKTTTKKPTKIKDSVLPENSEPLSAASDIAATSAAQGEKLSVLEAEKIINARFDETNEQPVIQPSEATKSTRKPKAKKEKVPRKRKTDDASAPKSLSNYKRLWNGVALCCFGINVNAMTDTERAELEEDASRIGKVASWLNRKKHTPGQLWQFSQDYQRENDGINLPRDITKFVEHWTEWQQKQNPVPSSASSNPDASPTGELSFAMSLSAQLAKQRAEAKEQSRDPEHTPSG
jgi:hypothetical protein